MAIIDVATYQAITNTTGDTTRLTHLCNHADKFIKRYLGIDIEAGSYPGAVTNGNGDSGLYSGNGSRNLFTRQRPILTVTSIYQDSTGYWGQNPDGSFSVTTLLVAGRDYALTLDGYIGSAGVSFAGIIERINGFWPSLAVRRWGNLVAKEEPNRGNIRISYTGGWASIPVDIVEAAAQLVSFWKKIGKSGGALASENLGAYSYSYATLSAMGIPSGVTGILRNYKLPVFA